MTLQITPRMLGYLSSEIHSGRALFALLRAREYLEADHPLFRSLVIKAKKLLTDDAYAPLQGTIQKIQSGARMSELSAEEQAALSDFNEINRSIVRRPVIVPRRAPRTYGVARRAIR